MDGSPYGRFISILLPPPPPPPLPAPLLLLLLLQGRGQGLAPRAEVFALSK